MATAEKGYGAEVDAGKRSKRSKAFLIFFQDGRFNEEKGPLSVGLTFNNWPFSMPLSIFYLKVEKPDYCATCLIHLWCRPLVCFEISFIAFLNSMS